MSRFSRSTQAIKPIDDLYLTGFSSKISKIQLKSQLLETDLPEDPYASPFPKKAFVKPVAKEDFVSSLFNFYLKCQEFQIFFIKFWNLFLKMQYDNEQLRYSIVDITKIPLDAKIYEHVLAAIKEPLAMHFNGEKNVAP